MIIESLIRLGRPFVEGGLTPEEVIRQITDVGSDKETIRDFFQHVFVVEIDRSENNNEIFEHPMLSFGDLERKGKREIFVPDERALAAPWIRPSSGNLTERQGFYGVPTYSVYENKWASFLDSQKAKEQQTSKETKHKEESRGKKNLRNFLSRRLEHTPAAHLSPQELEEVVRRLHQAFNSKDVPDRARGLIVLAIVENSGLYGYSNASEAVGKLVASKLKPGQWVAARLDRMVENLWRAKAEEGAEYGLRTGADAECSICRTSSEVVSVYSKAWPWLGTTWKAPFSYQTRVNEKEKPRLAESVALCSKCYGALTYGGRIFNQLSRSMPIRLRREIFSPLDSPAGSEQKRKGKEGNTSKIIGSAFVLPLLDEWLVEQDAQHQFIDGIGYMLNPQLGHPYDLHLDTLTGLDLVLPGDLSKDLYRLTIIYYTKANAEITLRAVIEDVIPPVAREVKNELESLRESTDRLISWLNLDISIRDRFNSLPYLLARAYGNTYLWQTLATVLHREPLTSERFVKSSAYRMSELSRGLPNTWYELRSEVFFYLTFREFLKLHNGNVGKGDVPVRPWQELQSILDESVDSLNFDDVEELGFAAGHLVRQFSRQYWAATKARGEGKDFLKHRIMTFGSTLTPEIIHGKAVARFEEWGHRVDAYRSPKLLEQAGVWLNAFSIEHDKVKHHRDSFMAAFWSGYWLQKPAKQDGDGEDGREE